MKKLILFSLIGLTLFFTNNAFATSQCDPTTGIVPCTYNGQTLDTVFGHTYSTQTAETTLFFKAGSSVIITKDNPTVGYYHFGMTNANAIFYQDMSANNTWAYSSDQTNGNVNINYTGSNFYQRGSNWINTIGITSSLPANNAINVNAYTTFTGTYDNDGIYDTIIVALDNMDQVNVPLTLIICDTAKIGKGVKYSCSYSGSTNTHYQFNVGLWDSTHSTTNDPFPAGSVVDHDGPYIYTTGNVYEVQTPPTSSTCSGFDVGCYLENAIGWAFGISQETLNQFSSLTLKNSLPFSYIYDTGNLYTELFSGAPQNFDIAIAFGSFGNITLLSTDKLNAIPFHGMVRTVLGAMMIFMTAMFLYGKIIGIHDSTSQTGAYGDSRPWHGTNI